MHYSAYLSTLFSVSDLTFIFRPGAVEMLQHFALRHIPALFVATTSTISSIWAMVNTQSALHEFGFPPTIATSAAAAPVIIVGQARLSVIGLALFVFYARGQLEVVDTILAILGFYAGLVDSWTVWRTGSPPSWALFRLVSSWMVGVWGVVGGTAGM